MCVCKVHLILCVNSLRWKSRERERERERERKKERGREREKEREREHKFFFSKKKNPGVIATLAYTCK